MNAIEKFLKMAKYPNLPVHNMFTVQILNKYELLKNDIMVMTLHFLNCTTDNCYLT